MTRLEWGVGPRLFDLGVNQGVLYLEDTAVPWNGLVSIDEMASGQVDVDHYFEGRRLHISHELGDFEARVSAYTYPDVFAEYNGWSDREEYRRFGFSYRTERENEGTKLHLVYNALVLDDQRSWTTLDARPDPSLFSWDIHAASKEIPGASPGAHLVLETPSDPSVLESLEDILYGTDTTEPRLPEPAEVIELYEAATLMRVTYNGDGTYTVTGPDDMVRLLPDGRFEIEAPSVFPLNEGIFVVHSH